MATAPAQGCCVLPAFQRDFEMLALFRLSRPSPIAPIESDCPQFAPIGTPISPAGPIHDWGPIVRGGKGLAGFLLFHFCSLPEGLWPRPTTWVCSTHLGLPD